MLNDKLQIYTLSIVFVGEFNPAIIQPSWLASKNLIREQEALDTKVDLIHNDLTRFKLDWVTLEVTKNRFELRTSKEPYFGPVKDLAISIFTILKETPITAVGINHLKHYSLTESELHNFGDKLAPLSNWSEFMQDPKVLLLEILEEKRKDGLAGLYRVKIQGSADIKNGVLINMNDNYSLKHEEQGRKSEIIKILGENWENSHKRANEIPEKIWQKTN
jgi:hypothetical protein